MPAVRLNRYLDAASASRAAAPALELPETLNCHLAVLSHLNQIAIRIPHVAAQFPTMIIERFRQEFGPLAFHSR
jgi:hypothetical protein